MSLRDLATYSMIILIGLASACVTAILYIELRWRLNPLSLVTPWLAVSGLMLGLAARPRQKPWPYIPSIAVLLCTIQLYVSQTFWNNMELSRMKHAHGIKDNFDTFYLKGIEENDPDGYDDSGGGMRALPYLGKKGYLPFFANIGVWSLTVFGASIATRNMNSHSRRLTN